MSSSVNSSPSDPTPPEHRSDIAVRGLLDSSRNFIGLMSPEGILLDGNRTALDSAGVSESDVFGKPFWETPWWTHSIELQSRLKEAIANAAAGQADGFEATHPTRDGSVIIVDFSLTPVFDAAGMVIYLIPEGIDITHRKHTEERLRDANTELKAFAYSASHDLRAPLRAISQLVEWIQEDDESLSEETHDRLSKIKGRVDRLERLLIGLLEYSRSLQESDSGPEVVDTNELLENVINVLDIPPGFEVKVGTNLPSLRVNAAALSRIFLNLIGNALKHHDKAKGTVQILGRTQDHLVEFDVVDDGPGIEPQYQERVFEMFQTLQSRDVVEGSGMGLAITRRTIRQMGGEISVESAPGSGSTFRFRIPNSPIPE